MLVDDQQHQVEDDDDFDIEAGPMVELNFMAKREEVRTSFEYNHLWHLSRKKELKKVLVVETFKWL